MTPADAAMWVDHRDYEPVAHGDVPLTVSDSIRSYCEECLDPYTQENINYLMQQLKWPEINLDGVDPSYNAFYRELLRILKARLEGRMPRARGQMYEPRMRPELVNWVLRNRAEEMGLQMDGPRVVQEGAENIMAMADDFNENDVQIE